MAKKLFVAAFVIDEDEFYGRSGNDPVDAADVVNYLSVATLDEGIGHFMVWDNLKDMIADHKHNGPITVAYLEG